MTFIGVAFFLEEAKDSARAFTQFSVYKQWKMRNLGGLLWIFGNDRDGAMGDTRGWWDVNTPFSSADSFWSMYWWLAIRNPAINFTRFTKLMAINTAISTVEVLAGAHYDIDDDVLGWQLLKANDGTLNYYKFEWTFRLGTKVYHVLLGHKFDVRHFDTDWTTDPQKAWKGSTFRIRSVKAI